MIKIKAVNYPLKLKELAKKISKIMDKEEVLEILEQVYDLGNGRKTY